MFPTILSYIAFVKATVVVQVLHETQSTRYCQAPVVQRADNVIHRITHYLVDSVIHPLNKFRLMTFSAVAVVVMVSVNSFMLFSRHCCVARCKQEKLPQVNLVAVVSSWFLCAGEKNLIIQHYLVSFFRYF